MKRFASAVVGLGQIGQGYDYDLDARRYVLTHATAFAHHPGFELAAGVDPDGEKRIRFEQKFRKPAYLDMRSMLQRHPVEVIAIGAPTTAHFAVFDEAIKARPRAVICEKPIAMHTAEAERMVEAADQHGCSLMVNYMRRFEPGVLRLKSLIQQHELGEIYKGVVWYSKGLLNNGSHYVDLLRFVLGECRDIAVIAKGRQWDGRDPEPDLRLRFGHADIDFLALREECFSVADMELVGTKGRIYYHDSGADIRVRHALPDPVYPGYMILNAQSQAIENDFSRYQWHTCEHLYRHLTQAEPLNSDGRTATETLRVIEEVFSRLEVSL